MFGEFTEVLKYRDMLRYMVKTDLRVRYKGSLLGFLWTFVNPLIMIIIYTVVFSTLLRVNIPHYTLYLVAGLLPWNMFQAIMISSSTSIIRNSNLVKKIYFPRQVLPLSVVFTNTINYLYSMVIVAGVMVVFHTPIRWCLVSFPVILCLEFLLSLGLALIVSSVNVYFRDVEHILTVLMNAWFYVTPIVFSLKIIPAHIRHWFYLNPMTAIIQGYVDVLYYGKWPDLNGWTISIIWTVVSLMVGWLVFRKLNRGFGEEI